MPGSKEMSAAPLASTKELPEPDICPGRTEDEELDGSVGILWKIGDLYLYIDVKDNGRTVHYYGQLDGGPILEKVWRA